MFLCSAVSLLCNLCLVTSLIFVANARPTPSQDTVIFPEQASTGGLMNTIMSGDDWREKLVVLKMITIMERNMETRLGIDRHSFPGSYMFQGDILLTSAEAMDIVSEQMSSGRKRRRRRRRKMDIRNKKYWTGPIHYGFDRKLNYTAEQKAVITDGLDEWERQTCISFIAAEDNYTGPMIIFKNQGCSSYVGQNLDHDLRQNVFIGNGCITKGIVAHEIGHVIGFWHEHARPDRAGMITILWENIINGNLHNFDELSWGKVDNFDVPFDLGSLMMYNALAYSINKVEPLETIRPSDELMVHTMGQRNGLSFYDVKLANTVYCTDVCENVTLNVTCLNDGYQDPKNCSRCRCPDGLSGDNCETVKPSNGACGGVFPLNQTSVIELQTPGYPRSFTGGLACNWLFNSPVGTVIRVTFDLPFMQSSECTTDVCHPEAACCQDFVEIRHSTNIANTGARFCCSGFHPDEIVSKTNSSLVLFRSANNGTAGVKATVSVVSCGGCHDNVTSPQVPCFVGRWYDCLKTWNQTCKWPCHGVVSKSRPGRCYEEVPTCCHGYSLEGNTCVATITDLPTPPTTMQTSSNTSTHHQESDEGETADDDVTSGSGAWSEWSNCTRECGGCGKRTRTRVDSYRESHTETEPCETQSCGGGIQMCERTVTVWTTCGYFTHYSCTKQKLELYSASASCCCGYQLAANNTCVPSP